MLDAHDEARREQARGLRVRVKRRKPTPPPATIAWTARDAGWASKDGRFTIAKPRKAWVLTDTRGPAILREQAVKSLKDGQRRAEHIMDGEDMAAADPIK